MAAAAVRRPLSAEALRGLLEAPSAQNSLPEIRLKVLEGASPCIEIACFLIHTRENGFMFALPLDEAAHQTVESLESPGVDGDGPAFFSGTCALETTRRRQLGECDIELVDVSWNYAESFHRPVSGRHAVPQDQVLAFVVNGSVGRPVRDAAHVLAAAWMETMDADTAQEYLTGEEEHEPAPAGENGQPTPDELLARIAQLESQLSRAQPPPVARPTPAQDAVPKAPSLFQAGQPSTLSAADWSKLKHMAGSPPPRVASAENRRPAPPPKAAAQENAFADLDREAAEEMDAALALPPEMATADPFQQMMYVQMQQNSLLLRKLMAPRSADPVLGALQGGGGGSDSGVGNSSGVKGCMARDAYVRAVQDLVKVSEVCRNNMLKELGIHASKEDGNLMRKYVERKVPLAEYRLLSQMAFMIAESWMIGFESQNTELLGLLARMMFFVEQAALDQGRTQTAWLLTGWQEPPYHILVSNKRRTGLQQFCKLCSPAWLAANLAYVKDLDWMESRMATVAKNGKNAPTEEEADYVVQPKRKPKGKGKGKNQQPLALANGASASSTPAESG